MSSVKAGTSLIFTRPTSRTRVEAGLNDYRDRREEVGNAETHTHTLHLFMRGRDRKFTALRVSKLCLSFRKGRLGF